jgi:hypothetical protein
MLSFKNLTILFMGATLFGGTVGATTASAATYSTATRAVGLTFAGGPGHPSSVWAGTWNNGGRGFCLDFGSAMPNRAGTSVYTGNLPGMTAEESKQAKFVANKYAATGSQDAAANASLAIWRYRADTAFNTWYRSVRAKGIITTARHNAVNAIIMDARQHAPYKMSVSTTQVQVGQTGSGTVKVLGSNGKAAVGRKVTLTPTQFASGPNGKILTVNRVARNWGYTGSTGLVAFTYQRTTTGTVGIKATLTSPSSARAGVSITSNGHQRTLSGGYTESAEAYYSYHKTPGRPTIASACDTDCDGQSTVTFRFANPSGAQAIKWTVKAGTVVVATLSAKPGTTGTAVARLTDGRVITSSSYCYTGSVLGGSCTTATVVVPENFEIVCPAWAQGELKLPCNCTPNLPASVTLTSPAGSPRFYRGFIRINKGAVTYQADLVNGRPTTITTGRLGSGTKVVVSFTVYRDAARTIPMASHVLRDITVN